MSVVDVAHGAEQANIFKRAVLNLREQVAFARNHWLASIFYGAALVVGAWELGGRYEQWRWGDTSDPQLQQLRDDQAAAFRSLDDKLSQLRGAVDGSDRAVVREVAGVVDEIKAANTALFHQLALARDENTRLSEVAGRQAGVSGGYDFILSENTGMRIDDKTVVGVGRIQRDGATVTLSGADTANRRQFLNSGESVEYRSAAGEACRVTLLSVTENAAASFDVACGIG